MVRTMLDEVRRAPLDDAGRRRLREIHEVSLKELEGVLSPDLRQELSEVVLPLTGDDPPESELRLAQAQLVGWLEGLFHGIQATLFTQQAMAQSAVRGDAAPARARRWPDGRAAAAAQRIPLMADWSPQSWRDYPAAQQPDWPDDGRARGRARRVARGAAARVRGRGAQPHRRSRARRRRARRSCSRPATAPSRSTCSRPTPSATSSR